MGSIRSVIRKNTATLRKIEREAKRQHQRLTRELDRWTDRVTPLRELSRWPTSVGHWIDREARGYFAIVKASNPLLFRLVDGRYPAGYTAKSALRYTYQVYFKAAKAVVKSGFNPTSLVGVALGEAAAAAARVQALKAQEDAAKEKAEQDRRDAIRIADLAKLEEQSETELTRIREEIEALQLPSAATSAATRFNTPIAGVAVVGLAAIATAIALTRGIDS